MKKWLLLQLLLPLFALSQVGVNNTAPEGMLDVTSTNNGVLIPRVALTSALDNATVVNPQGGALAISTLVYNTAASGTGADRVIAGFYYWNGSRWVAVGNGQDWSLSGNTGITAPAVYANYGDPIGAGENFVGTTDNRALVLGTYGIERMRFNTSGSVSIGTPTPAARFHVMNNGNYSKTSIFSEADQTVDGVDYQNVAITGYSTGQNAYGLGAGVMGIGNVTNSNWYASGVYAGLGPVPTTLPQTSQALYANGNGNGLSGYFTGGNIRYVDGNQGAGRVLTSDAAGIATWQLNGIANRTGVLGTGVNMAASTSTWLNTGTTLTLPPGRWAVQVTMLIAPNAMLASNASIWVRSTFTNAPAAVVPSPDIEGSFLVSGNLSGSSTYGLLNGMIIINNPGTADRTYYYKVGQTVPWNATATIVSIGGGWDEDTVVAYRLN